MLNIFSNDNFFNSYECFKSITVDVLSSRTILKVPTVKIFVS